MSNDNPTMSDNDTTHNGWKNYETWNIALWIQNDEGIYNHARELLSAWNDDSYGVMDGFDSRAAREICLELFPTERTPDNVRMHDFRIDWNEISDMLLELHSDNECTQGNE